jgi:hypothetical protein
MIKVLGGSHATPKKNDTLTRRKPTPWTGWQAPGVHERTVMLKDCGRKCFLGKKKSFPICSTGTCKINKKGVWAAYLRAKEYASPKMQKFMRKTRRTKRIKNNYKAIVRKTRQKLKIRPIM